MCRSPGARAALCSNCTPHCDTQVLLVTPDSYRTVIPGPRRMTAWDKTCRTAGPVRSITQKTAKVGESRRKTQKLIKYIDYAHHTHTKKLNKISSGRKL